MLGVTTANGARPALLVLYAATLFVSAFLLFLVQAMFPRPVLPLLGGSPAVWNTAMVFFQGALLAVCRGDTALTDGEKAEGKTESQWLLMAREPEAVRAFARDPRWEPARTRPGVGVWTDDYPSILTVFNWR
jgi:hypothetical protein